MIEKINEIFENSNLKKEILRISMALVFLYFGFIQVRYPDDWTGYVPEFLTGIILTANSWVMLNGILELTFGTFLLLGLYTRISALILSLHLLIISFSIGLNPVGIRDFGLAIATFVVALNGADKNTLDRKFNIQKMHTDI